MLARISHSLHHVHVLLPADVMEAAFLVLDTLALANRDVAGVVKMVVLL